MNLTVETIFLPESKLNINTEYCISYLKNKYDTIYKCTVQEYRSIANDKYWNCELSNDTLCIKNHLEEIIPKNKLDKLIDIVVNKKGLPDLLVIKNNVVSFIELKINRDGISKEQIIIGNTLQSIGFDFKFLLIFGD